MTSDLKQSFNRNIILFLLLTITAITFSYSREIYNNYIRQHVEPPITISQQCLENPLEDLAGNQIQFRAILNRNDSTLVYFFNPTCVACKRLNQRIRKLSKENIIAISFSFSSIMQSLEDGPPMDFPIYITPPSKANLFSVSYVPCLMEISRTGQINKFLTNNKTIINTIENW